MATSTFAQRLRETAPEEGESRRWLFVPYDQLTDALGPLASEPPSELGIVLVESPWKASRRPYHKQKLALVLANGRHFALEQARRGVAVRHVVSEGPYREALAPLADELGPLRCMRPAERELRADLAPLVESGALVELPHDSWLTSADDFTRGAGEKSPWRMDRFYRHVRRRAGVLVDEDGKPEGGKWSFDAENRRPYQGEPDAPKVPRFRPDEVTREVVDLVEEHFADHPGELDPGALPASRSQAQRLLRWALEECLPTFGPFEDAMAREEPNLFHTRLSALIHLHRITPAEVLEAVLAAENVPLASREGFVRQLIGWREFVRHVHERTDGFRVSSEGLPQESGKTASGEEDGGARPSFLGAESDLPPAFWGTPSGLECLDHTVAGVWRTGYSHHILRLMVLSNLATLLDVSPRQLTDWFLGRLHRRLRLGRRANVLAMGTFGTGELMTTKPYVSGAAYIDRMSDFCGACAFDPKRSCPITSLYWAFLDRHRERLEGNMRVAMPLRSLASGRTRSASATPRSSGTYRRHSRAARR